MTLSVCMIVRDEAPVLERCLDSLRGVWDELIVLDTGSVDETPEIARRYTDKVFFMPWEDDFAAARNRAFSYATGDWLLSIGRVSVPAKRDGHVGTQADIDRPGRLCAGGIPFFQPG